MNRSKTIDLALPVAEMISEHGNPGIRKFKGMNLDAYHPAIRDALKGLKDPFEEIVDWPGA